jgi:hypothetical protein
VNFQDRICPFRINGGISMFRMSWKFELRLAAEFDMSDSILWDVFNGQQLNNHKCYDSASMPASGRAPAPASAPAPAPTPARGLVVHLRAA